MAEPLFMLESEWSDVLHCLRETAESDQARARKIRETAAGLGANESEWAQRLARTFDNQAARFLALEKELQSTDKHGRTYF